MPHLLADEPHWSQFTNETNNRGGLCRELGLRITFDIHFQDAGVTLVDQLKFTLRTERMQITQPALIKNRSWSLNYGRAQGD